jgi:hypothetical protein
MSSTIAFEFSSLKEIQALKSSVFGSNLIETISLTFQNNARHEAGKEVLAQLNELKNQLNTDQKNDDATFNKKSTEFKNHIQNLANEIQTLTEEILKLEIEIERLAGLIEVANKNIVSFRERIANLEELLTNMAAANADDNKYYNQKIEELERLYQAFTQMIEKLNKLKGSVSGVNKYEHINATESELRDIAWRKANSNTSFVEVDEKKFLSFLQITNQETNKLAVKLAKQYTNFLEATLNADQAALEKLVSILTNIQDETLVKKANTIEHLNDINARYAELKKSSEEEIASNKESLQKQIENRDQYVADKQKAEEDKRNKEERRDLLIKEKAINEKLLSELEATHQKEKAARAEEMNVVNILERIVEKRLMGQ